MPKMTLPLKYAISRTGHRVVAPEQPGRISFTRGTGKNRRLVIMKPGDTLDIPADVAARHLDKLIPAEPTTDE